MVNHYNECYAQRDRCLHCNDCIAFALIYSEALKLRLPPRGVPYAVEHGHAWNFVKFLGSTISREYLPCERALPYAKVRDFAWALLRLPLDARAWLRGCLICHCELASRSYQHGIRVFRMGKAKLSSLEGRLNETL